MAPRSSNRAKAYDARSSRPDEALQKPDGVDGETRSLADLHEGRRQARDLAECLSVDFSRLAANVLGAEGRPLFSDTVVRDLAGMSKAGITKRMQFVGDKLAPHLDAGLIELLSSHPADTVRGWLAYGLAAKSASLEDALDSVRALADDPHFGVREWTWMAVRPKIEGDPRKAISHLISWPLDASERICRFATESIRPRGVWAKHIPLLCEQPEIALPLLEAAVGHPSLYVQDSLSNWLNDAGKTRPDFVVAFCDRWSGVISERAVRRAKRNLKPL